MKNRSICVLLTAVLVLLFCCGCAALPDMEGDERPGDDVPLLYVSIVQGMEEAPAVSLLLEDSSRRELEKALGAQIVITQLPPLQDVTRSVEIGFSGVLLLDDPRWIVPLANEKKLEEQPYQTEKIGVLGKYFGKQYGYTFRENAARKEYAVLAVDKHMLEKAGIREIPFTPEAFLDALVVLATVENYTSVDLNTGAVLTTSPLAVYGSPTGKGFWPLLALFDIVPTGGEEFCLENGLVSFDKITDNAQQYLAYLQVLYDGKLIPSECLLQNAYSAMELLVQGRCAMAVLPNETLAREAVARGNEMGKEIALVQIPVEDIFQQDNACTYVTGLISAGQEDVELARRFFELLQEAVDECEDAAPWAFSQYPLFGENPGVYRQRVSMVEEVLPDIRRPYEIAVINSTSALDSFYYRIMTRDISLNDFSVMRQRWLQEASMGSSQNGINGASLLELYNRWYYNP